MYQTIFFDLDGTLTDSGQGITNAVAYALKRFGIENPDPATLYKFVGPPLIQSFGKYYGLTEEQGWQGVLYYREYYMDRGIYENRVYDGIEEVLKKIRKAGRRLVVATAKPEEHAKIVLDHFGLTDYFDLVAGAALDETRTKKPEVIAYALEKCGITDRSQVVMVGDRDDDVKGAKQNGIACIGVLYGYGGEEELRGAGAGYLAETPEDILKFL